MPEVLLDAAGRPRSPATLAGFHWALAAQQGPAVPGLTRRRSLRSSSWCGTPARVCTRRGSLLVRRGKRRSPAWGRHGRLGLGTASALARRAHRPSRRSAAAHRGRPDPRTSVVSRRRTHRAAPAAARTGVRRRFAPSLSGRIVCG